MKVRHSAGIYFALQAIAIVVWWLCLFLFPESRVYFQMGDSPNVLMAFWLPDLFFLAMGSAVTSAFCFYNSKLISIAAWFVCGAISYAAFYCLAFALLTDSGWLGVTLMLPAMLWSGVFSVGLSATKDFMFRKAKPTRTGWILTKTAIQIIVVWSLILFIIPSFIVRLEDKLGVPHITFPFQKPLAAILFVLISLVGISGAYTMSRVGKGTPLPLDSARNLVIKGIYAYVRNPMAISGIGQGLAVALFLGSSLVLIYALMGGLIWQLVFRPLEEDDLLQNFGEDYENYRREVRCWTPRINPYQPE